MRGRIVLTPALILSTREHRETDRLAVLYTEAFGKIRARFIGVDRPQAKLKALSEPMVFAEYRLYMRDGAEFATVAGGALDATYPGLRRELGLTLRGLEVCELLDQLTPFWKPNSSKLELAVGVLKAMETAGSRKGQWLLPAFTLRLLELAGFGHHKRPVSEENSDLWETLHTASFAEVAAVPADGPRERKLEIFLRGTVEQVSERELKTSAVRERLAGTMEAARK